MPTLSRRNFLQVTGAAGLVPVLPALPASAAAATTSSATSAQMLWASLIAKAGNAQNAASVASAMGVPNHTAQGIFAQLVQKKLVTAQSVAGLSRLAPPVSQASSTTAAPSRSFRLNLEKLWADRPVSNVDSIEEDQDDADDDQTEEQI